ncbi:MAG: UDP-N-acetylmuramoyl-L-alanine--D-glutamate ligase [Ruminococcaceae bacterium]|nr:UDP-N-acetylmuramoyl-L-alanine--D-glutamate ligase [Oscillospiraceae bacterium]
MQKKEWFRCLQGTRVMVIGLGISNLPLIDFLLQKGALVTACDAKERAALGDVADRLEARGVRLIFGKNYLENLEADVLFRTPGIRPDHPQILAALERGAVLSSEMELFFLLTPARIIGITGSDGKTTTTTLTGLILDAHCKRNGRGRVFVGGNIGAPLLPRVEEMQKEDFCVVELSSFQLQTMRQSPEISAVTNLSENHLNWHTDMEEYVRAKTNIFLHPENERVVLNAENEESMKRRGEVKRPVTLFSSKKTSFAEFDGLLQPNDAAVYLRDGIICFCSGGEEEPLLEASKIRLPGLHNLENYMTALALTHDVADREDFLAVAECFEGVRHRLEKVRVLDGVTYYNSSIDSSPTRTAAALSALSPIRPIVICGGADKNCAFPPLAESLCKHAKAVVLTGATAEKINAVLSLRKEVQSGALPVYRNADFEGAVTLARTIARAGDTVLLSPACTSFDAFRNFEERGDRFCAIVRAFHEMKEDV